MYLFNKIISNINRMRLPRKRKPNRSNKSPMPTTTQKAGLRKIAFFGCLFPCSSLFIKSTANTGFIINATINDAVNVKINIVGR